MRLRRLEIQRLPGIAQGFALEDIAPGVNVIVGPNASGKSSVVRALRAVLYRDEQRGAAVHVEAAFDDAAGRLSATRLGPNLTWHRHGQPLEPPPLPEHRFVSCYTLHVEDLLDADGSTDREIALRLARELAGGYDLQAVRTQWPFQLKQNHGQKERKALQDYRGRQREKQAEHRALRQDEARLADLKQEKDACAEAAREAGACAKALELLEARRRRRDLEARLEGFPAGMDRLGGDERKRLDEMRRALHAQELELRQAQRDLEDAQRRLAGSALAGSHLDERAVADRRHRTQRLQQLETQAEQYRADLERADAERQASITALGGEPQRLPLLQPDTLHGVEAQLTDKRRMDAKLRLLDETLAGLPDASDDTPDAETLRQGRDSLLSWLATPAGARPGGLRAVVVTAVTAALTGIGAAAALVNWGLALIAVPLAVSVFLLLRPSPESPGRREARRRFAACGLSEPSSWETSPVLTRLRELDRQLQDEERRRNDLDLREKTERRRAALASELEETRASLGRIAEQVGFDPSALDGSFERWLRLVGDYDRAHVAVEQARRALDARLQDAQELRAALVAFLNDHDEAPGTDRPDSGALRERLDRLSDRVRQRDGAQRDMATAERDIARATKAIEQTQGRIRELFTDAGLESADEAGLAQRLERLEAWQGLTLEVREVRALERDREQDLGDRPDLTALVEADDKETLQTRSRELKARAARRDALGDEITRIKTLIGQAEHKRELEDARADFQAAEDALHERLDEARFAAAGAYLLDLVREEHVQASQPAALRRAADWFERFTHHQYTLEFTADGEQRFAARETSTDERRDLTQLSSGTRMQLLLAVRIAFALEAERGREPLPLVLDEALTTADPERFAAAADSLSTLARENDRQVFYLTAQPADIDYWLSRGVPAQRIDLAEVRRTGHAVSDERRITVPPQPETPTPGDRSPEAYAVALGVPYVDPWSPPAAVHVFYLLRDDLHLLHRLIQNGVRRIGPLRALLHSAAARSLLTDEERHTLERRVAAVESWFEAWRRGRGRPVDRQALTESQAVSATFLAGVATLNERLGGEAQVLLDALANGAVDRFRSDKRKDLEAWFTEHGYLDGAAPLTEAEIGHRLAAVLIPFHQDRDKALKEAQSLAASLKAGLEDQPASGG